MSGLWHSYRNTREDLETAKDRFRNAIQLDANFADGYAALAYATCVRVLNNFTESPKEELAEGARAAQQAVSLENRNAFAQLCLGRIYLILREYDKSIAALERSLEINPNSANAHYHLGSTLNFVGRYEDAFRAFDLAIRLSPRDPMLHAFYFTKAVAAYFLGDDEQTLALARKSVQLPNAGLWNLIVYAGALSNAGHLSEAEEAISKAMQREPNLSCEYIRRTLPFRNESDLEDLIDKVRRVGLPEV